MVLPGRLVVQTSGCARLPVSSWSVSREARISEVTSNGKPRYRQRQSAGGDGREPPPQIDRCQFGQVENGNAGGLAGGPPAVRRDRAGAADGPGLRRPAVGVRGIE